jgi:hypothetical protein
MEMDQEHKTLSYCHRYIRNRIEQALLGDYNKMSRGDDEVTASEAFIRSCLGRPRRYRLARQIDRYMLAFRNRRRAVRDDQSV